MQQPVDERNTGGTQDTPEWMQHPERSNVPTINLIVWIALTLGRHVARALLIPICIYFLIFSAAATRAASRKYLGKALGRPAGVLDLFRHYHAFASTILDRVYLLSGRLAKLDIRLHNLEAVQAAMAHGRGCILLGAHVGSFEAVRGLGRYLSAPPANMVMYEDNARKLGVVLNAINPELARRVIALGKPDSMLKVRDALRRGEFVGILADRVIEGEGSVPCEFFGETARFPIGPLRMAFMMNAPVLVMAGMYLGGNRYDVYFETLLDAGASIEAASPEATERTVRRYAAQIEAFCRIAPYNWFNFFDFWDQLRTSQHRAN